ncbi:MAG: hypothetical protein MRZ79_26685 [Bacteroidia bacterium]|nr:hypothetical protein [Bacteroidia bacterium]
MKKIIYVLILPILLLFGWNTGGLKSQTSISSMSSKFEGGILAASDADMVASAYGDGVLGKIKGIEDTLTFITNVGGTSKIQSTIAMSNSVLGWPAIMTWSKSKKYAYLVENNAPTKASIDQVENVYTHFPSGKGVSVVDYADRSNPKVVQEKSLGETLQGVAINATDDLLVIASSAKGREIIVATLIDGLIDQTYAFSEPEIDYTLGGDVGIKSASFHPSENVFALNLNNQSIVFYEVIFNGENIKIQKIGSSLKEICTRCTVGNWHPKGKYFLTTDVNWSGSKLGYAFNKKGKLLSIAFDQNGNHKIASKISVGLSPEGFDISPNGQYAVTVNMRRTYLPQKFWFIAKRKTPTLSLIKIDSNTGKLTQLGEEYGFAGALPEDAIFDKESNSLAVAVFHEIYDMKPRVGWVDFWEIKDDKLYKTASQVKVTRGVHTLHLID